MKRHLAPALFSLSLCAVMGGVRTAGAQTLNEIAPTLTDSATIVAHATLPVPPVAIATSERTVAGAPVILAAMPMTLGGSSRAADETMISPAVAAVDWKMPTSRALIIGGTATALVGLFAVGHDTGAIIALSGTAVAVYGLYLHYNR